MEKKSFPLHGGASPYYIFIPVGLLQLALAAAFVYFVVGPKRFTVNDRTLEVSGSVYSTSIERGKVVADKVRVVDIDREAELAPRGRTNGLDLFAYKEGWFNLRTGDKAFVILSNSKSAVYIPTTAGYSILFSAADPEKLIASLH
jgi:hypothetical protein